MITALLYLLLTTYCLAAWGLGLIMALISADKGCNYWLNWVLLPFAPIILPVMFVKAMFWG